GSVPHPPNLRERKQAVCLRVAGAKRDRAFEDLSGTLIIIRREAAKVPQRPRDATPRIETIWLIALYPDVFCRIKLGLDRRYNAFYDLILNCKDVLDITFVSLGPNMIAGYGIT